MPSSTITCRQIKKPDNHNVLENTYVYIKPTFYYWSVWYGNGSASLMCCYYEDNPAVQDNWIECEVGFDKGSKHWDTINKMFQTNFKYRP